MIVPAAIICVNEDISLSVKNCLIKQLFINEVMDGYTFDTYITNDSLYPAKIKQLNRRIMIMRNFANRANVSTWTIPDVVIYVKQGLGYIEINKFGPTGLALSVLNLYWGAIGIF